MTGLSRMDRVSLGLAGAIDHGVLRQLAPLVERAGFRALWLNDTKAGDSLAGLAVVQEVTSSLLLATGVIALDRRSPREILEAASSLDPARLTLGVGSGGARSALELVSSGVAQLRAGTSASVVVGGLGPRMRHLAATQSDGVLLNWLTPRAARAAVAELRRDGGEDRRGILYVRTVTEPDALLALAEESAAYQSYPAYAAHFERIGATALDTTIDGSDSSLLRERVHSYSRVVDEVVLRAIVAEPTLAAYTRFVESVAQA